MDLQNLVIDVAKVVSGGYQAVAQKSLAALVGLVPTVLSLRAVNFPAAVAELKVLSPADRGAVEAAFVANFDLGDPALNAKVVSSVGLVDDAVGVVASALAIESTVLDIINRAKALVGA